jgi:TrmH family RNA methyltransferase
VADITSPANPRVKQLVSLRKRSARDAAGLTVVEGYDELRLALSAGVRPSAVFCCPELVADPGQLALMEALAVGGTEVVRLSRSAFAKAAYRESPDGWLAVVSDPGRPLGDLMLGRRPLILVAEGVEKPGNLGAMLRTADAAGADAVVAASPGTDWGNPNLIRASKGAVFAVPVAAASTPDVVTWLRERGLVIVVATPDATTTLGDVDLARPVAVVVGAEHEGVSPLWHEAADATVTIPMAGRVNSLNVAASAAIVLYEAVRQRAALGHGEST